MRKLRMFSSSRTRATESPNAARLEVGQRQAQQVAEQPSAELDVDAARGVAEDVGAQRVEHAFEQHHDDQADDEHIERGQAAVHEHLVHHHLEEQRADQREELKEEGDHEHLAQQLAVLDEAGQEPGEVELRQFACQRCAAGDEDQLAAPLRSEDCQRLDGRAACLLADGS